MTWPEVAGPLVTLLFGGVGGYLLKFYLDQKASVLSRIHRDKRRHYRNLLLCLKSLSEGSDEHLSLLYFEYSFLWLHASDRVIRAANRLLGELGKGGPLSPMPSQEIAGLLAELRKDLGIRTRLGAPEYVYGLSSKVRMNGDN